MNSTARAIAARMQGDDYQARWFFIQALRMLDPSSPVARVGLEQARFPWFDDIVTFYRPSTRSARHAIDAHQIKFHVIADGALSFESLMDPAFIGSKNKSLLQRIVEGYRARGSNTAVVLMSPWGIAHDDLLGKITQTGTDGSLRLHLLFDGKQHSFAAEIRSKLRAHARIEDLELRETLDHFRVEQTPSLPRLQSMLDDKLARHRFKTVGDEALANIYDDLGRKLISLPSREFDADGFRTLLRDEGLVDDGNILLEPKRVGIRSFVRQAEYLDEFTTMLDLLDVFDLRHLRPGATWCKVSDRVRIFMAGVRRRAARRHRDASLMPQLNRVCCRECGLCKERNAVYRPPNRSPRRLRVGPL